MAFNVRSADSRGFGYLDSTAPGSGFSGWSSLWETLSRIVLQTMVAVQSRSPTSMMSQGAEGVFVAAIIGITTLSLHLFGSMWSSVRNVPSRFLPAPMSLATDSMWSSSTFRKTLMTMVPVDARYFSNPLTRASERSLLSPLETISEYHDLS